MLSRQSRRTGLQAQSGRITPYWHDYYARQGLQVPEGEPGSNPGDLSRSAAICILGIVEKE